jgi:S-adenosylmethionine/arginine decarboxylase-like enzyme
LETSKRGSYGAHLTIDAYGCHPERLADLSLVYCWLKELPEKLGMEILFPPYCHDYVNVNPLESGVTGIVGLTTSHASIHTYPYMHCEDAPDVRGIAFVDVFSCRPFDVHLVVEDFKATFGAHDVQVRVAARGERFPLAREPVPRVRELVGAA